MLIQGRLSSFKDNTVGRHKYIAYRVDLLITEENYFIQ